MKRISVTLLAGVFALALLGAASEKVDVKPAPLMTKEQLRPLLGSPDLTVIDVRVEEQWKFSNRKIPGAVHEDPELIVTWEGKYPKASTLVVY
jgi:3-mercaptopyruvate sulfurtransferase SseA